MDEAENALNRIAEALERLAEVYLYCNRPEQEDRSDRLDLTLDDDA